MQTDSYSNDPDWADVQPIPQDDGENPLVPIAYSRECKHFVVANVFSWIDEMNFFFLLFSKRITLNRFWSNGLLPSRCPSERKVQTCLWTYGSYHRYESGPLYHLVRNMERSA